MGKNRLEAISDGVLAIIITIMVLEMKVPHGDTLQALHKPGQRGFVSRTHLKISCFDFRRVRSTHPWPGFERRIGARGAPYVILRQVLPRCKDSSKYLHRICSATCAA